MSRVETATVATVVLIVAALGSCVGPRSTIQIRPRSSLASGVVEPNGPATSSHTSSVSHEIKYRRAINIAERDGLRVWLGADLVKRWLEGRSEFKRGVMTLGALATLPGVVGIKIADELGYHDGMGNDPTRIQTFLADAAATLHRVAPGKLLLVDMIVPQLGCAPGLPSVAALSATCAARAAALYPALTLARVDRYVRSSDISVLDLSTGLLDPSIYLSWGIDRATAQRAAWAEVARRGWGRHVRLQARKALAHPGAYDSSRAIANTDLHDFVDIPLDMGAQAVDIWTWRQTYKGAVVRLMNPGLTTNPLWQGLVERRRRGARLFTHFTPSSTERGARVDLRTLSQAFTDVFMAAGIG